MERPPTASAVQRRGGIRGAGTLRASAELWIDRKPAEYRSLVSRSRRPASSLPALRTSTWTDTCSTSAEHTLAMNDADGQRRLHSTLNAQRRQREAQHAALQEELRRLRAASTGSGKDCAAAVEMRDELSREVETLEQPVVEMVAYAPVLSLLARRATHSRQKAEAVRDARVEPAASVVSCRSPAQSLPRSSLRPLSARIPAPTARAAHGGPRSRLLQASPHPTRDRHAALCGVP
jgi:hypothetical protein